MTYAKHNFTHSQVLHFNIIDTRHTSKKLIFYVLGHDN